MKATLAPGKQTFDDHGQHPFFLTCWICGREDAIRRKTHPKPLCRDCASEQRGTKVGFQDFMEAYFPTEVVAITTGRLFYEDYLAFAGTLTEYCAETTVTR